MQYMFLGLVNKSGILTPTGVLQKMIEIDFQPLKTRKETLVTTNYWTVASPVLAGQIIC